MLKIRRSWDRLIFNMGMPILVRRHLYNETAPRLPLWHGNTFRITAIWYGNSMATDVFPSQKARMLSFVVFLKNPIFDELRRHGSSCGITDTRLAKLHRIIAPVSNIHYRKCWVLIYAIANLVTDMQIAVIHIYILFVSQFRTTAHWIACMSTTIFFTK